MIFSHLQFFAFFKYVSWQILYVLINSSFCSKKKNSEEKQKTASYSYTKSLISYESARCLSSFLLHFYLQTNLMPVIYLLVCAHLYTLVHTMLWICYYTRQVLYRMSTASFIARITFVYITFFHINHFIEPHFATRNLLDSLSLYF